MPISELGGYLLISGLAALLLHFLLVAIQLLRKAPPKATWINAGLALLTALTLLAATVTHTFFWPLTPTPVLVLSIVFIVGMVLGVVLLGLERRHGGYSMQQSPSLLFLAGIVFTGAIAVFIPILPQQFWPAVGSPALAVPTLAALPSITPTPRPSVTATLPPSPTATATTASTLHPTATPTRMRYNTRTPSPTPTLPTDGFCDGVVDANLNMRRARSLTAEVILVIPVRSTVNVVGKDINSEWWFIEYNGEWGWVVNDYVTTEARCEFAPVVP